MLFDELINAKFCITSMWLDDRNGILYCSVNRIDEGELQFLGEIELSIIDLYLQGYSGFLGYSDNEVHYIVETILSEN